MTYHGFINLLTTLIALATIWLGVQLFGPLVG